MAISHYLIVSLTVIWTDKDFTNKDRDRLTVTTYINIITTNNNTGTMVDKAKFCFTTNIWAKYFAS